MIEQNPSFFNDIRLYSHSGLCNRLRLIAEYRHLSDTKNKNMEMFWVKSVQCNALFKDLFNPIPNIKFTYLKYNKKGRQRSLRPENTATKLNLFPHSHKIKNKNHLIFKPVDDIMEEIESEQKGIGEDYISCHIRRTDIITIQKKYNKEPPSDEMFIDFIERYPDKKIYLATDERDTQKKFIDIFGDRIYHSCIVGGNGHKRQPYRTTSIKDAVKDIFLCIGAIDFMGTVCSSFSGFIENYRKGQNE
jgi:hypothetical protein